ANPPTFTAPTAAPGGYAPPQYSTGEAPPPPGGFPPPVSGGDVPKKRSPWLWCGIILLFLILCCCGGCIYSFVKGGQRLMDGLADGDLEQAIEAIMEGANSAAGDTTFDDTTFDPGAGDESLTFDDTSTDTSGDTATDGSGGGTPSTAEGAMEDLTKLGMWQFERQNAGDTVTVETGFDNTSVLMHYKVTSGGSETVYSFRLDENGTPVPINDNARELARELGLSQRG
ncbi:MAG TPA: hypothetical protein VEI97_00895, partial [bacterium]|nr:hypothetical protein [bacterium]